MAVEDFSGSFIGSGTWYDSVGASLGYTIEQTHRATKEGIDLSVKHIHADGNDFELSYQLKQIAPYVYRLYLNGNAGGYGAIINDTIRFHFDSSAFVKDHSSITELSFRLASADKIEAYGSSTKNSAGNYIMWYEELTRVD